MACYKIFRSVCTKIWLPFGFIIRTPRCNYLFNVKNIKAASTRFDQFNHKAENFRLRNVALAGILTFLGLKEEEEEDDPLILTIKYGVLYTQRKQFDKAEAYLHSALKMAQERKDSQAQTYIFDLLANVAFQKGDVAKAEKLFIEVMKELIASGTPTDDNAIVDISLKLATIYSQTKQDEKAEQGFRFCIETQRNKLNSINVTKNMSDIEKDTALLWAMSFDWYARYLMKKGSLLAAQENLQKALDISETVNGPEHPQTLILLNDMGYLANLKYEYDHAVELFEKAIKRAGEESQSDLPEFYCNLGTTHLLRGDLEKASKACSEALKLSKVVQNETAEAEAKDCLKALSDMKQNKDNRTKN